ncbi:hypothetical protein DVH05_000637 [Phytophthora capsici]|nr:hypothetical protein DVH05_000637 [Phytophthora capsici]
MELPHAVAPVTIVDTQLLNTANGFPSPKSSHPSPFRSPPVTPCYDSGDGHVEDAKQIILPIALERKPTTSCSDALPPSYRSPQCASSTVAMETPTAAPLSRQHRFPAATPLTASIKRRARPLDIAALIPPKRSRSYAKLTTSSDPDTDSDELLTTKLDRCIQKAAAGRREYARRVLAALNEEKQRRRRYHEVKNRFYVERLVEIRANISEQMISEHIDALAKNTSELRDNTPSK